MQIFFGHLHRRYRQYPGCFQLPPWLHGGTRRRRFSHGNPALLRQRREVSAGACHPRGRRYVPLRWQEHSHQELEHALYQDSQAPAGKITTTYGFCILWRQRSNSAIIGRKSSSNLSSVSGPCACSECTEQLSARCVQKALVLLSSSAACFLLKRKKEEGAVSRTASLG